MNKRFWIFAGLCVLVGLVCAVLLLNPGWKTLFSKEEKKETTVPVSGVPLVLPTTEAQTEAAVSEKETEGEPESLEVPETEAPVVYVSPIDFAVLQEKNPDIYAWISIEGTDISYPLVQSTDDSFYLDHDENRESNSEGTIYSESTYNGKTFDDSITALYGHHMKNGRMFGNLQATYSEEFEKYRNIVIYTPEKKLHYRVFAAVPYDNRHIPFCYGNAGERGVIGFLQTLTSVKSLDAIVDEEELPSSEDKFLVLSTCLKGDRTRRYIVVAKLVQPE